MDLCDLGHFLNVLICLQACDYDRVGIFRYSCSILISYFSKLYKKQAAEFKTAEAIDPCSLET